jgi:mRNA interferase RelE/StbE
VAYDVSFKASALKEAEKLPKAVRLAVAAKAESLANNPRPVGCAKLAGATNLWRVRVGNYRIVYAISDKDETVEVRIVAHRRDVYARPVTRVLNPRSPPRCCRL